MTLTEFLLARIAEDEEEAASLLRTDAVSDTDTEMTWGFERDYGPTGYLNITPARVLAECQAKRRIVDLCIVAMADGRGDAAADLLDAVRALASVHKGHPDYRQGWEA